MIEYDVEKALNIIRTECSSTNLLTACIPKDLESVFQVLASWQSVLLALRGQYFF